MKEENIMKFLGMIPKQETWNVIDSSKLSTFMECPRKFFYEYVLGWRSSYPNNHLVFGVAWHLAVEHFLLNNYSDASLQEGIEMFYLRYRQELDAKSDEGFVPKDPRRGIEALQVYHERFKDDVHKYDILYTELGGSVLLADDSVIYFKLDALLRERHSKKVIILDHKSSQRHMNYWSQSWNLSTQMLTYLHAAKCMYGTKAVVDHVRIRGAF